ncbi:MAG: hypothetical protein HFF69_12675 [Oscillospiraceae bacterium]|nr:hypothetical protein [Oscillospiraceae bacterium]
MLRWLSERLPVPGHCPIAVAQDRQLWTALGYPCQSLVYTGLGGEE